MKLLIRYFSLGLLTAGIVMLGILLFSDNNKAEELTIEEIIPMLKEEGYHVLTNDEYISMSINSNSDEKEEETEDNKETESNEEEKKVEDKENKEEDKTKDSDEKDDNKEKPSTYTLNIKSGMPTSSISEELEKNDIIKDASEFTNYLEEHDYALKVKAKKVKVNSDMSHYEIAQALVNY